MVWGGVIASLETNFIVNVRSFIIESEYPHPSPLSTITSDGPGDISDKEFYQDDEREKGTVAFFINSLE